MRQVFEGPLIEGTHRKLREFSSQFSGEHRMGRSLSVGYFTGATTPHWSPLSFLSFPDAGFFSKKRHLFLGGGVAFGR